MLHPWTHVGHSSSFQTLPDEPGQVEQERSEDHDCRDPLVVTVVDLVVVFGIKDADSGMDDGFVAMPISWRLLPDRPGASDPAVVVDQALGHVDFGDSAVDGVPEVLLGTEQGREEDVEDDSDLVEEPEGVVVSGNALEPQ